MEGTAACEGSTVSQQGCGAGTRLCTRNLTHNLSDIMPCFYIATVLTHVNIFLTGLL